MNFSLILEEYVRKNRDLKIDRFVAFLHAKAAFDVVNHSSLIRKHIPHGISYIVYIRK